MTIAQSIHEKVTKLPLTKQREALAFVESLVVADTAEADSVEIGCDRYTESLKELLLDRLSASDAGEMTPAAFDAIRREVQDKIQRY